MNESFEASIQEASFCALDDFFGRLLNADSLEKFAAFLDVYQQLAPEAKALLDITRLMEDQQKQLLENYRIPLENAKERLRYDFDHDRVLPRMVHDLFTCAFFALLPDEVFLRWGDDDKQLRPGFCRGKAAYADYLKGAPCRDSEKVKEYFRSVGIAFLFLSNLFLQALQDFDEGSNDQKMLGRVIEFILTSIHEIRTELRAFGYSKEKIIQRNPFFNGPKLYAVAEIFYGTDDLAVAVQRIRTKLAAWPEA